MNEELIAWLERIEAKLDVLIAALAEEEEEPVQHTLDGSDAGRERDATMPL